MSEKQGDMGQPSSLISQCDLVGEGDIFKASNLIIDELLPSSDPVVAMMSSNDNAMEGRCRPAQLVSCPGRLIGCAWWEQGRARNSW